MTLPEMVFGDSKLAVKNEAQGLEFSFKAYEALDACARAIDVEVMSPSAPSRVLCRVACHCGPLSMLRACVCRRVYVRACVSVQSVALQREGDSRSVARMARHRLRGSRMVLVVLSPHTDWHATMCARVVSSAL